MKIELNIWQQVQIKAIWKNYRRNSWKIGLNHDFTIYLRCDDLLEIFVQLANQWLLWIKSLPNKIPSTTIHLTHTPKYNS